MKTDSLETLNLGHNPITNEGIHLVKDGLLKSKSLLKLGLSGTKVTCEGRWILIDHHFTLWGFYLVCFKFFRALSLVFRNERSVGSKCTAAVLCF